MKRIFTTLFAASLMLGLSTSAFAAKGANKPETGRGMEMLKTELGKLELTDDQNKQCTDIIDQATQKVQAAMADAKAGGEKEAVKEKVKPIVRETMQKLMAVLTPEQKTKFRAAVQEKRQERKAKADGKASDGAGATTQPAA